MQTDPAIDLTCSDTELFSSLLKLSGSAEVPSHQSVTAEITIASSDPFQLPATSQEIGVSAAASTTLVVDAEYNSCQRIPGHSTLQGSEMDTDPLIMSTTRKQWLQRINGQHKSAGGSAVRGQVQASGADLCRRVKIVTPEKLHPIDALVRVDVRRLLASGLNEEFSALHPLEMTSGDADAIVGTALTKPCFSPFEPGICAFGTGKTLTSGMSGFFILLQLPQKA